MGLCTCWVGELGQHAAVKIRLGDGASGTNFVVTSHALKWSETTTQQHTQHTTHKHITTHNTGFKQDLSTPAIVVHKSLSVAIHFLWSPSWHRNLRKARARARARLRFSVPEELVLSSPLSICVQFSGCGIITAVHHRWLIPVGDNIRRNGASGTTGSSKRAPEEVSPTILCKLR